MNDPPVFPVTATVLGIGEFSLLMNSPEERTRRFVSADGRCFVNEKTGAWIPFGSFDTPTVEALQEQVAQLPVDKANNKKKAPPLTTRSNVDIGALQGTLNTNDCAMVQVASNFNCLENGSRRTRIDSGDLVDGAFRDYTQGPAAVFGTTSAYLYRAHFVGNGGGQSSGPPVNLLQHTSPYFGTPEVGKLTLTGKEVPIATEDQVDPVAAKVCVGLHTDCPVMFGRSSDTTVTYNEPETKMIQSSSANDEEENNVTLLEFPLVDQVLSASINLHDPGIKQHNLSNQAMMNLMRALLRAAYEGIYLAAILRQRKVLYLTLVGGGSFGNPIPLIVQEIQRAHRKWASHPASQLEECIICLYTEGAEQMVIKALKEEDAAKPIAMPSWYGGDSRKERLKKSLRGNRKS